VYTPESSAEEDTLDRQRSGQGKSKKKFGLQISPKLTLNKQIWEAIHALNPDVMNPVAHENQMFLMIS
tara:strand:- start:1717 stop:1920 length:204 start_codon:yes stop_codon:yes gene_type:complete